MRGLPISLLARDPLAHMRMLWLPWYNRDTSRQMDEGAYAMPLQSSD
jgi:hypothetical protein